MSYTPKEKKEILSQREDHINDLSSIANRERISLEKIFNTSRADIMQMTPDQQETHAHLYRIGQTRRDEIQTIIDAPYFSRITLNFDKFQPIEQAQVIHIGKFSLPDENVYSWIAPVAQLRFMDHSDTHTYTIAKQQPS